MSIFKQILDISIIAPKRSKYKVLGKVTEEIGEMATIINKPNKSHSEPLEREIADAIIAATDLMYVTLAKKMVTFSPAEVAAEAERLLVESVKVKNDKWAVQVQEKLAISECTGDACPI